MSRKFLTSVCFFVRYTVMVFFFIAQSFISYSSSSVTPPIIADLEYIIPQILIDIAFFLLTLLVYYSITRTFSISDPRFNSAVKENKDTLSDFTERATFVLKTPFIYFEILVVAFFFTVTTYSAVFIRIYSIIPKSSSKFIVTVLMILGAFILSFLAKVSAIKELCFKESFEVIKFGRGDKKYGIWYLLRTCLLLSFIYPIAVTMVPYVFAIAIVPFLFDVKDTLTIISVVVAVIILLFLLKYWIAFSKRRKFIKKLRIFCKKNKFALENESNMIRSVFKDHEGANFVINARGKRYACKLITSKSKADPMYFTENGEIYVVKAKSLTFLAAPRGLGAAMINNVNLSKRATVSSFAFESKYPKLIIVNPIPTKIFAGHPEHSMPIDVGSEVGEYKIFNASGFINAVDRDCVEIKKRY